MPPMQKTTRNLHIHTELVELPFHNLSNKEFNSLFNIDYRCVDSNIDLYKLLPNPDKLDESDLDHMLANICSDYYQSEKVDRILKIKGPKSLSLLHCNIRSLPKNLNLLKDMTYSLSEEPDTVAITETKLNNNPVTNIDMSGYKFYHVDSVTAAGGAGIYVCNSLKVIERPDIKFSMVLSNRAG